MKTIYGFFLFDILCIFLHMNMHFIVNEVLEVALEEDELDGFDGLGAHDEATRDLDTLEELVVDGNYEDVQDDDVSDESDDDETMESAPTVLTRAQTQQLASQARLNAAVNANMFNGQSLIYG
jgi:hypothetical protein